GYADIALSFRGYRGAFTDDKAGPGALAIVERGELIGNAVRAACARHGSHDDTVAQLLAAKFMRVKQLGHNTNSFEKDNYWIQASSTASMVDRERDVRRLGEAATFTSTIEWNLSR